jgi:hypothetical protein
MAVRLQRYVATTLYLPPGRFLLLISVIGWAALGPQCSWKAWVNWKTLDFIWNITWEPELPSQRPEIQDFCWIRLPTLSTTYHQRCSEAAEWGQMSSGTEGKAGFTVCIFKTTDISPKHMCWVRHTMNSWLFQYYDKVVKINKKKKPCIQKRSLRKMIWTKINNSIFEVTWSAFSQVFHFISLGYFIGIHCLLW